MKIRLYGGPGHGRMVYIPGSVAIPPPEIGMPLMTPAELEQLLPLDPGLEEVAAGIRYRAAGAVDADGYARYDWVE